MVYNNVLCLLHRRNLTNICSCLHYRLNSLIIKFVMLILKTKFFITISEYFIKVSLYHLIHVYEMYLFYEILSEQTAS